MRENELFDKEQAALKKNIKANAKEKKAELAEQREKLDKMKNAFEAT